MEQDSGVFGRGVLEIVHAARRHSRCWRDQLLAYCTRRLQVVEGGYSGSGGEEGPRGHHGQTQQFAPRDKLISIPVIRKFSAPSPKSPPTTGKLLLNRCRTTFLHHSTHASSRG